MSLPWSEGLLKERIPYRLSERAYPRLEVHDPPEPDGDGLVWNEPPAALPMEVESVVDALRAGWLAENLNVRATPDTCLFIDNELRRAEDFFRVATAFARGGWLLLAGERPTT